MPAPDSLRDGEPDAAVAGLGGEERLGGAPEDFRAHAAAGIPNASERPSLGRPSGS